MEIGKAVKQQVQDLQPTSKEKTTPTNPGKPTEDICLKVLKHHFYDAANILVKRDTRGDRTEYVFTEGRKALVSDLLMYFMRHSGSTLNPDKPLLIRGPVGCGKTMLFRIVREISKTKDWVDICGTDRGFKIENCIDVADSYARDGFKSLDRFVKREQVTKIVDGRLVPINYLLDDLGTDDTKKFYGNEINVLAKVIDARYNHWINSCVLTHITTNLTSQEIETAYGTRVKSRMTQMYNEINISDQTDYRSTLLV